MDADKLHKMLKPLPNDFDEFIRERFQGAWTGYIGMVYPDSQFIEEIPPEKMLYCTHCRQYFPTDIKISGRTKIRNYVCPNCLEMLHLFSISKKKNATERHETFWLGQNIGEKIFVLRGFRVTLRTYSPAIAEEEEIIKQEIRRLYVFPEGYYREYCGWGYDSITKRYVCDSWETRAAAFASASGPVHPSTYEEAKGTAAEYSHLKLALEEGFYTDLENWSDRWGTSGGYLYYSNTNDRDSIWDYLTCYAENRRVEMLVRLNMPYIIGRKQRGYSTGLNGNAKNPWDYLKIYKSRLKGLTCTDGNDWVTLCIYRMERKLKTHFTDEEINVLSALDLDKAAICLKYMTPKQLVNRVNKYSKDLKIRQRETLNTYSDYLHMKEELGYDMTNSIYVYPRNLKAEHDKCVIERNERVSKKRAERMNKKFEGIALRFKRANKIYSYHSGKFFIRPAKDASEIVNEGRVLHHCVGGENYLLSHANKRTIILFLRTDEDVPYITVEMKPDGSIAQWYGEYDKKPDKDKIDRWLKKYQKQLDKKALKREAAKKGA